MLLFRKITEELSNQSDLSDAEDFSATGFGDSSEPLQEDVASQS